MAYLKKYLFAIFGLMVILLLNSCSNSEVTTLQEENIQLHDKINSLSNENKRLIEELDKLKNGANALYQEAITNQDYKMYSKAYDEFDSLVKKFPLDPLVNEAKKQIDSLMQLQASEYSNLLDRLKNEKDFEKQKQLLNNFLDTYSYTNKKDEIKKMISDIDKQIKKVQEEASKPPLSIVSTSVKKNSAGTPEATVIVKNTSKKTIDAFTIRILCFNNYNNPVNHYLYDTNVYNGIDQLKINPGETSGYGTHWSLFGYDNTTKIKVVLNDVHFTDNTIWVNPNCDDEVNKEKDSYN